MDLSELKEEIAATEIRVHPGRYAYLKCEEQVLGDHFMITRDQDEVTIVTKEENVSKVPHSDLTGWFKLFEFKITKPFVCVGFLATITGAIAEEGINVLVTSTYSKDYILIGEEDVDQVINILKAKGFSAGILTS